MHDRYPDLVRPPDWHNPDPPPSPYHLVVVGAGTAGLVAAVGAANLGARVALIERARLGGDCLNWGCVPSKALIRSARVAATIRRARRFGIEVEEPRIDGQAVMERVRALRAEIAHHDSAERMRGLGIDLYLGDARFLGPDRIAVADRELRFRRAILATGARAAVPPIPGLADAGYETNETIFELERPPGTLAVIGGGPIGCELAQAFARLGSEVTLVEAGPQLLAPAGPEAGAFLAASLAADGVRIHTQTSLERVERHGELRALHLRGPDGDLVVTAERILVAVGRRPNVEDLGLEAAGIAYDGRGVHVDDHLRTSNRRVFAAGDVCLAAKFTHTADFSARIALANALFRGRRRLSRLIVPWVIYTSPEVAHVGPSPQELEELHGELSHWRLDLSEVDRARLDGANGWIEVWTPRGRDRLLAARVVAPDAGDLLAPLAVALRHDVSLEDLADTLLPYPTTAEAARKLGDLYNRSRLTPRARRWTRRLIDWLT